MRSSTRTGYVHAGRVSTSQHVRVPARRASPRQHLRTHHVVVDPVPGKRQQPHRLLRKRRKSSSRFRTPYSELRVVSHSVVEVSPREDVVDPEASPAWEDVRSDDGYNVAS